VLNGLGTQELPEAVSHSRIPASPHPRYVGAMPELPDVTVYVESLERRIVGEPLTAYAILNVFALRSVEPSMDALVDRVVHGVRRLGKRIVIEFDDELRLVVHLMIAGRFRWIPAGNRALVPDFLDLPAHERPGERACGAAAKVG